MERKDREKKKIPNFLMPGLRRRLLVYAAALLLAALSGIQLAEECFPEWPAISFAWKERVTHSRE